MKGPRPSSCWIVAIATWMVFPVGISLTQAQMNAKPSRPQPATWTVQIPAQMMFNGDLSGDYIHGTGNVEVTVQKYRVRGSLGNSFVTDIGFRISTPTERRVHFSGVSLDPLDPNDYEFVDPDLDRPCCLFPVPVSGPCCGLTSNACSDCSCIQDFLNYAGHPYTDVELSTYRYFLVEIDAFDKDLDLMSSGESYQLGQTGHLNDFVRVSMVYQTSDREPTYHNISLEKSAHLGEASLHPFNVWIKRTGDSRWTVEVGRADAPQFLFAEEWYYERTGKRRIVSYSTLFQGGDFYFTFDLIKN